MTGRNTSNYDELERVHSSGCVFVLNLGWAIPVR